MILTDQTIVLTLTPPQLTTLSLKLIGVSYPSLHILDLPGGINNLPCPLTYPTSTTNTANFHIVSDCYFSLVFKYVQITSTQLARVSSNKYKLKCQLSRFGKPLPIISNVFSSPLLI